VAIGICPEINIQPFKAPIADIAAPAATKYPAYSPPIILEASAKGAGEFFNISIGNMPIKLQYLKYIL
jgi:hypothetical protein